jgi:hypothetical protein
MISADDIFYILWNQCCGSPGFGSTLKKKFRTHVIKLDIAPKSYPPGQYLLVSASNNIFFFPPISVNEIKFAQLVLLI